MKPRELSLVALSVCCCLTPLHAQETPELREAAKVAMKNAASFYREQVASHGGYVYFYSLDLQQRWGEGVATESQVWIQPPGAPTVGLAYLKAYQATGEVYYLQAATETAMAVAYGQLKSGGWTNSADFDPRSPRTAEYRNGRGRGKNNSTLDDGITQSAIGLLMHVDRALKFQDARIHDAAEVALGAVLKAQFANGAFPQVWDDELATALPATQASYPDYDWRTEGRIKNYWDMYTLNDDVAGYVADMLVDADQIYQDPRYLQALRKLGDFLLLAQMPDPQPGWAQQYNYQMKPIWARKFEPPGVSGDESQEVIDTLMTIFVATGQRRYLQPIPRALSYLKRSLLPDGQLARYYELKTNRPLYMQRTGKVYELTYDDSRLPSHYGWKIASRLGELEAKYNRLASGRPAIRPVVSEKDVRDLIASLDSRGRWVSVYGGERLVGQAKMPVGAKYLSSERFSGNLTVLSEFILSETKKAASSKAGASTGGDR